MGVGMTIEARDINALHLLVLVIILAATLKEGIKVSTIARGVAVGSKLLQLSSVTTARLLPQLVATEQLRE
jgi:hypothetical protein